jgi:hypothetical protein
MEPRSFEGWEIDLGQNRALHHTGFSLQVEGDPKDPSSVAPSNAPNHMSVADQALLLREGMAALAAAAGPANLRSGPRIKSRAQQEAEARAKLFAERSDKPVRPRLSLKKTLNSQ